MTNGQLTDLDLRLLRVMNALLEHGSVTRAASALGVTPSAVSHSLSALRLRFGDQLFVRHAGGLTATPRALAIQPKLQRALIDLENVLVEDAIFDPATSERQFSLASTDFLLEQLRALVSKTRDVAPRVGMSLFGVNGPLKEQLASGEIDLVLTYGHLEKFLGLDHDTMRVTAAADRFVCIMRPDHPAAQEGSLDLTRFAQLDHILLRLPSQGPGLIDRTLESMGKPRRVMLTVTSAAAVVKYVESSDLIATIPYWHVHDAVCAGKIIAVPPPLHLPSADIYLWWHMRVHNEPAHIWWRGMTLKYLVGTVPQPIHRATDRASLPSKHPNRPRLNTVRLPPHPPPSKLN
ncbi:LysR family transcriptional regulator [Sphingomonas sp.]|uniref:LysR family transcriptional regulator n=1 Tax=Sphingomonas sp. TaxID=28214 RepID=UPI003B3A719C